MEYGLYNWWPKEIRPYESMNESLDEMIHPDDLQLANEMNPMGKVFIKTEIIDEYIVIEFGCIKLRVRPNIWHVVIGHGFKVGDDVKVLNCNGKNTEKICQIVSMSWHHKNKNIIYHLSENGKRLKKNYVLNDIERI